jgi:autotransporter-associated beta strand protein
MKPSVLHPLCLALSSFSLCLTAQAQSTLLTDNFTVTGTPDATDPNFNLSGRQSGTQVTQSWTKLGPNFWQAQVGNAGVFGGDGNYLMVADAGGGARLEGLTLSSALVPVSEKLVIQFDADATGEWMSFMMSPSSGTGLWHPVVGSGDFGMLIRPDGRMQAFNNNGVIPGINDVFLASAGINTITLTFTGSDGTGSPFAGNGTRVSISDGTNTWSATLDAGLSSETIAFGSYANGGRGLVDNLSITTVPSFSPGRWSGETNGTWDENTVNFSGKSFSQMKTEGVTTATFADIDGSGNPVTQDNVTIAAGGVDIADVLFTNNAVNYTLNSADANGIKGSTNLSKIGSGTLTLAGANSYTGTTTVSNGTLALSGGNNRLPVGTALTLSSPAVLRLDGNNQEVASLASNGRVVGGSATLSTFTLNHSSGLTLGSVFGGPGTDENNLALVKTGAGGLTLNAPNTYTGGTTIGDGTVTLDYEPIGIADTPIGSMTSSNLVTINNGGILTGTANNWLSNTGVSSGGANAIAVTINPGGTLKGTDNRITGLGNVTLNGGTIEVSNGLTTFGWFASYNLGGDITVGGSVPSFITTSAGAGASANFQLADGNNNTSGGGIRFLSVADVTSSPAADLVISARLSNGTLVKDGPGTVEIAAGETGTGFPISWEITGGSLVVAEPATFEFRVTDSTSNRVFESSGGNGSATFNGTLQIESTAVSGNTGMIWSLIDVAALGAQFGPNFNVAGFTGPDVNGVWTRSDAVGDWSFSQQTGELSLDVGSDYETWKSDNNVIGDPAEDDDNDGVPNFEEYAFGLNPQSGSSVSPITVPLDRTAGTFTYTRRDSALTDLNYTVWFSTDLSNWNQDTGAIEGPAVVDGEVETVTVTLSNLAGDPLPGKLFVQVRAE